MENFKSVLLLIIILAIVSLVGFWAVSTIESGSTNVSNQKQKELENKNKEFEKEITDLKDQIKVLTSENEELKLSNNKDQLSENTQLTEPVNVKPVVPVVKTTTVLKYQSLINELQKIYNDKTIMEKGAKGLRVGTIQKFLNIYNNTSTKIDNDFGPSMVTSIIKFQKDVGLSADGGIGSSTVSKMIDWLKKQ